jgi:hypothetical protein
MIQDYRRELGNAQEGDAALKQRLLEVGADAGGIGRLG